MSTPLWLINIFLILGLTVPSPVMAQNANQDLPIPTWQAPAFWDAASARREHAKEKKPEAATQDPQAVTGSPVTSAVAFVGIVPCRLVDTRGQTGESGAFGPPIMAANETRTIPVLTNTRCNIPASAQAYSLNFTVVPTTTLTYLSGWPTGNPPNPLVSILNSLLTGGIVANAAVVPGGANGSIDVFVTNQTQVIIDINGYYAPQIPLAAGSAAAPSLTFGTDNTTGLYSSATGAVNIATGGVNRLTVRPDGDLDLTGNVRKNGTLFVHNLGQGNTSVGSAALNPFSTGSWNTAMGYQALNYNTTGASNTATGNAALYKNTTGNRNTAIGDSALNINSAGSDNTAVGFGALSTNVSGFSNTATGSNTLRVSTGSSNTANGNSALANDTSGSNNTAMGDSSLLNNTAGGFNTAVGGVALGTNTTGTNNTATGYQALTTNVIGNYNTATGNAALKNSTGTSNTAMGSVALFYNGAGNYNTAIGDSALLNNTTGSYNIALGANAGNNLTTGDYNIAVGHSGIAGDGGTIRIGDSAHHSRAFLAGVRGVTTGQPNAAGVVIDSNGQLGTVNSSRRFKEDIRDMAGASSGLLRLRPVTFRYARPYDDGSKPLDYGLIAEEVAEVYPDLVVKGADGQVETVQYQKLAPMLLNELQKQHKEIGRLKARLAQLEAQPAGSTENPK